MDVGPLGRPPPGAVPDAAKGADLLVVYPPVDGWRPTLSEGNHGCHSRPPKEGLTLPIYDDYYLKSICPPGGHGRGHRLALQNRAAARHHCQRKKKAQGCGWRGVVRRWRRRAVCDVLRPCGPDLGGGAMFTMRA